MILDTIFSFRRIERLSRNSYHLAKTAFESTPCGQTIKCVFGGAVCSVAHQSSTQLDGSSAEDESSLTIDWMDGKPAPGAVQTSRLRLHAKRPNMYTDLC